MFVNLQIENITAISIIHKEGYKMENKQNNKLLIAKIEDKICISKNQNKITNSEFLNEFQVAVVQKELLNLKEKGYFFYGGYDKAIRKILIIYPDKLDKDVVLKNINDILVAIKIELPNELQGKIKHKDYLGTVMSFGLTRERIGDIIVYEKKAYIVVLKENSEYLKNEFKQEKRFKKAKIEIIDINKIESKPIEFEEINISVNSLRLDNIIAEILKTSRKTAQEQIAEEKVFLNYIVQTKNTKNVNENDVLVIRGHGKYIIEKFMGKNKKRKRINTNKEVYMKIVQFFINIIFKIKKIVQRNCKKFPINI